MTSDVQWEWGGIQWDEEEVQWGFTWYTVRMDKVCSGSRWTILTFPVLSVQFLLRQSHSACVVALGKPVRTYFGLKYAF